MFHLYNRPREQPVLSKAEEHGSRSDLRKKKKFLSELKQRRGLKLLIEFENKVFIDFKRFPEFSVNQYDSSLKQRLP